MRGPVSLPAPAVSAVLLLAGSLAWSQLPPGGLPMPGGTVTARPDTAVARLWLPDSLPQPSAVHVVQDTLTFGGLLHVVLDYPAATRVPDEAWPVVDADWLAASVPAAVGWWQGWRKSGQAGIDLSGLAAAEGPRRVHSFRVYRRDPLRLSWDSWQSPVLVVRNLTVGSEETAAIRSPRSLDWRPWQLILALVVLATAAWLLRRWWRRRTGPAPLAHWPLPEPAWLEAALGLDALLTDGTLDRGETRRFLDRLAGLARSYVGGRYRIAAREMTGQEIVRACAALGYEITHPTGFAALIERADRARYNPETPSPDFCRTEAALLFARLQQTRLNTGLVPLAAQRQLQAEQAWARLAARLGHGANSEALPDTAATPGGAGEGR